MSGADTARPSFDGRVLVATRSGGKVRELRALLDESGFHVQTLDDLGLAEHAAEDALEVYESFAENALAKARYFHARAGGCLVLAEDSGLCVHALGGAPGVRSKRWSASTGLTGAALDAANCEHLVRALAGETDRRAWYACAAVLVWSGGELVAGGETHGTILGTPCGDGGFGYDPYFWSDELGACFGAIASERKATVSHRGRAVRSLLATFRDEFAGTS